jgi:hypothetical protein
VQPYPSRLFFDGRQYVFKPGAYARPKCNPRRQQEQQQQQREAEQQSEQQAEAAEPKQQGRIRGWAVQDW